MNKRFFFIPILQFFHLSACTDIDSKNENPITVGDNNAVIQTKSPIDSLYALYQVNKHPSISRGSVGNGSLENGRILPFTGSNFRYFDTISYINRRAFVHEKVSNTLLDTYQQMEEMIPDYTFGIMECSHEFGGKLQPHRTHQNGLSVDFMTPLLHKGKPTTTFSDLGAAHYLMVFDEKGNYTSDVNYYIYFELIAQHLLKLSEIAKRHGLSIEKVIWKNELKDELFATKSGKLLQSKGIYFASKLTPLVNNLHDDHYHVDFKIR